MKSKKIYTKLLLAGSILLTSASLVSCDDFLTILPTDQLPEEGFWREKGDLENVRAGAYELLAQSGQTSKILLWGEIRSDNLSLNDLKQTDIDLMQNKATLQPNSAFFDWGGFYTGINYCNLVLEQGEKMTVPGQEVDPSFTRSDFRSIKAEMLALRSLYYFYLVRAYRDVPYVTKSVRTDKEAMSERPTATPGVAILGECIDSLEANLMFAADNFGSNAENKGRFTKLSVHALLADMYLWRACLLKNFMDKKLSVDLGRVNMTDIPVVSEEGAEPGSTPAGRYTTADGTEINAAYCNELVTACLNKSIEHCDYVLDKMKKDYDKRLDEQVGQKDHNEVNQPYPLILNSERGNNVTDLVYYEIFGQQNSTESILELQYDGSTTTNGTVNTYFSQYDGQVKPQFMTLSTGLTAGAEQVNPTIGFGRTDFRLLENAYYATSDTKKPMVKFALRSVAIRDPENLTDGDRYATSFRSAGSNDAHWPVYRLTDVMLIKAEAVARTGTNDAETLKEAFRMVNQIFARNNPALLTTTDPDLECDRVDENFSGNYGMDGENFTQNASQLLTLLYRERQREFVGEGKRWFDLVRQAEFANDSKEVLSSFTSLKSEVVNRLGNLWGMYNPYYSEELKVNGVENGGGLVQNPVWERYTKK